MRGPSGPTAHASVWPDCRGRTAAPRSRSKARLCVPEARAGGATGSVNTASRRKRLPHDSEKHRHGQDPRLPSHIHVLSETIWNLPGMENAPEAHHPWGENGSWAPWDPRPTTPFWGRSERCGPSFVSAQFSPRPEAPARSWGRAQEWDTQATLAAPHRLVKQALPHWAAHVHMHRP